MSRIHVIIIGGGLGGLCAAHGLRGSGVEVDVFERASHDGAPPPSYGIHLNDRGLGALEACLPPGTFSALLARSTSAPDVVRFWDPSLRVLFANQGHGRRQGIRRDALLAVLREGLEDVVQWDKTFTHYEEGPGGVTVHFADGTTREADVLVAADGSHSRVRAQRLPGLTRRDLGIVNIAGRTRLTSEIERALPEALLDGSVNQIVPSGAGWLFVSVWNASDAERYAVWAWVGTRASYPRSLDTLGGEALRAHVQAHVASWAPPVGQLVKEATASSIAVVPLRTMPSLGTWSPSHVTLMGDAIHSMTPMAGIGANTALRDAAQLSLSLNAPGPLLVRVGDYERVMRGYANEALAKSTRNARAAASASCLSRGAFRALLRLLQVRELVFRG